MLRNIRNNKTDHKDGWNVVEILLDNKSSANNQVMMSINNVKPSNLE